MNSNEAWDKALSEMLADKDFMKWLAASCRDWELEYSGHLFDKHETWIASRANIGTGTYTGEPFSPDCEPGEIRVSTAEEMNTHKLARDKQLKETVRNVNEYEKAVSERDELREEVEKLETENAALKILLNSMKEALETIGFVLKEGGN